MLRRTYRRYKMFMLAVCTGEDCVTTLIIMAGVAVFKAWDLHTAGVAIGMI